MPNKPALVTLTNSSVDVLNAIRNSASMNYQNYVPIATPDADSIRKIGAIIMDNVTLQNEFVNALVNRIGRVIVTSKLYDNPWASFKLRRHRVPRFLQQLRQKRGLPHPDLSRHPAAHRYSRHRSGQGVRILQKARVLQKEPLLRCLHEAGRR